MELYNTLVLNELMRILPFILLFIMVIVIYTVIILRKNKKINNKKIMQTIVIGVMVFAILIFNFIGFAKDSYYLYLDLQNSNFIQGEGLVGGSYRDTYIYIMIDNEIYLASSWEAVHDLEELSYCKFIYAENSKLIVDYKYIN